MKPLSAILLTTFATIMSSADELPPPEHTEYWEPIPPIVSSPAGGVPSDAIVLFSGGSFAEWESVKGGDVTWALEGDAMVVAPSSGDIRTLREFGDVQLHLEFRSPAVVKGESQGRGNSGVFFMERYEVQVLDSFNNPTYVNGQLGSIYKQHPPRVQPARPPGEWQSYDIVFVAPRFDAAGTLVSPARITAFLNGVLVQHDAVLAGDTVWRGAPSYSAHGPAGRLKLQDHGDLVAYRNIWVRELSLP